MHVNYWAPEVFSRVWRGAPAEEYVQTWPKPETAFEKPSAFSLQLSKTKFERNSSQEYYDITYIGKTYKQSRSVFPCEIFGLSKLSSLSYLS